MWGAIGISAGAVFIAVYEIRAMAAQTRGRERKRNIIYFLVLLIMSSGLFIAQSLQVALPNPLLWIKTAFDSVGL